MILGLWIFCVLLVFLLGCVDKERRAEREGRLYYKESAIRNSSTIGRLRNHIYELSDRLREPKGGSIQNGARNYLAEPINAIRDELQITGQIEKFPVHGQK